MADEAWYSGVLNFVLQHMLWFIVLLVLVVMIGLRQYTTMFDGYLHKIDGWWWPVGKTTTPP